MVTFKRGAPYPYLKAFRWNGPRQNVMGIEQVRRHLHSILYTVRTLEMRYALRFDSNRQRWVLEAIDASDEEPWDMGRPRCFAGIFGHDDARYHDTLAFCSA